MVIANGLKQGETILDIVRGKQVGTFITKNGHVELASSVDQLADDGTCVMVDSVGDTPGSVDSEIA